MTVTPVKSTYALTQSVTQSITINPIAQTVPGLSLWTGSLYGGASSIRSGATLAIGATAGTNPNPGGRGGALEYGLAPDGQNAETDCTIDAVTGAVTGTVTGGRCQVQARFKATESYRASNWITIGNELTVTVGPQPAPTGWATNPYGSSSPRSE